MGWSLYLGWGVIEGAQGAPFPNQGTLHKIINIYEFFMALFINSRAEGKLAMYGGLEMWDLNWQRGGRAHNRNELQPIAKITQFREEYDNSAVDKFAVLMLEPSSHQRHWRISGEISSLPLLHN